jgi:hypothetical protein
MYRWDAIGTGISSEAAMESLEGHAKASFFQSVMAIGFLALLTVLWSSKLLGIFIMNPVMLQGILWSSFLSIILMFLWIIVKAINMWSSKFKKTA